MALLIQTGEMEAIPPHVLQNATRLKHLRSADLLYLDNMIEKTTGPDGNGGFAKALLDIRRATVHFIEFTITSLRSRGKCDK